MSAEEVSRALSAINQAWLEGRPRDLSALFDPKIVTLVPGGVRVEGREALVQSFVDMCENARVHAFEERDRQVDVFGDAAVASVAFTIAYEREGASYRATGRDVWVFSRREEGWRAVYRTMLDLAEEPLSSFDFTERK
jgi:uncharacterized protein (TIGR02246 family)